MASFASLNESAVALSCRSNTCFASHSLKSWGYMWRPAKQLRGCGPVIWVEGTEARTCERVSDISTLSLEDACSLRVSSLIRRSMRLYLWWAATWRFRSALGLTMKPHLRL